VNSCLILRSKFSAIEVFLKPRNPMGPFFLTPATIDTVVTSISPGVFFLGQTDNGAFRISQVGRSDADLNARLKEHVSRYREFQFEYCASSREAFERECGHYHALEPPDNKAHPIRPPGSQWRCPACLTFG
jgi:hypothetical protein